MELNVLKHRLKIFSVKKTPSSASGKGQIDGPDPISPFVHSLVKCAFFKETGCQFFSFTETCDDYTVIIDERGFAEIPACDHVVPSVWIALNVSVGAFSDSSTCGISKIAKTMIIPLADLGVPIYSLSTFQNDFILVKEEDLDKALRCLANFYKIFKETKTENVPLDVEPFQLITGKSPRPITHQFTSPKNRFYLSSYNYGDLSKIALPLIQAMFYSSSLTLPSCDHEKFFTFAVVDEDVSIVLDETTLKSCRFNKSLFLDDDVWRMVKIGDMPDGQGFEQCGIVAQMSEPIADANISEYYLSSYYYGHTLVPEADIDLVLNILKSRHKTQKEP